MFRLALMLFFLPTALSAGVIVLKNGKSIVCHGPYDVRGAYLHYKNENGDLFQLPLKIVNLEKSTMEDPAPEVDEIEQKAAEQDKAKDEGPSFYEMAGHDERADKRASGKTITDTTLEDYARKRGPVNAVKQSRMRPEAIASNAWFFLNAVRDGNLSEARGYLAAGMPLDGEIFKGRSTPLEIAVKANNLPMVAMLVEAGADVNWVSREGDTPLLMAAKRNRSSQQTEIAALLLKADADPNFVDAGKTAPLHYAVSSGNVPLTAVLLKSGATPHLLHPVEKEEPLIVAIAKNKTPIVEALLAGGADPNAKNRRGIPALSMTIGLGSLKIMGMLLKAGADPHARDSDGDTPLAKAVQMSSPSHALLLLEHGADPNAGAAGRRPLDLAVAADAWDMAEYLVAKGAEVQAPQDLLTFAIRKSAAALAALLLDGRADVNGKDSGGDPPLVAAAREGNLDMTAFLLDRGADPQLKGRNGYSAYLEASGPRKELIQELIEAALERQK